MHHAIEAARDEGLTVDISGDRGSFVRLEDDVRRAVGLAVRQCLANVIRHSGSPTAEVALSAADIACYAAKDGGRNRVQIYERDHGSSRHREMQWVGRIAQAVEDGRLELFAQRIFPTARTSDTPFYELMVRLREADGTLVPPNEFIPAAERYNVMIMVDRWVVNRAIELLETCLKTTSRLPGSCSCSSSLSC